MDGQLQMVPSAVTADDVGEPHLIAARPGRFLFIDVAAMRAKQLRAGARPRISAEALAPHKLEWVAMEEVRRGLVSYELPSQMEASAASLPSTLRGEWVEMSSTP